MTTTVSGLVVQTSTGRRLVDDVNFSVASGQTLGLVGESGSGKSLTLKALAGLLPSGLHQTSGELRAPGRLAMVFQDPVRSLDPLCPVVRLVAEVMHYTHQIPRQQARTRALELLLSLGLPEDLAHGDRYPGQLSGGQCQRVGIAVALAREPDLLLCDEPTTALDVTVQSQILQTLTRWQHDRGFAMVFVTHNLAVASSLCTDIVVLNQGRVVEEGPTAEVLGRPKHPYTQQLVRSVLTIPRPAGGHP